MAPSARASATRRLGCIVLTPTRPPSASTSSRVQASLRRGLSSPEIHAPRPGVLRPSMAPGLGQWAVTSRPSSSRTSAKKRLYRWTSTPRTIGWGRRMGAGLAGLGRRRPGQEALEDWDLPARQDVADCDVAFEDDDTGAQSPSHRKSPLIR